MKKVLIITLFIYSLQATFAQTYCPAGAKWTYGTSCGGTCNGIIVLTYSGDTIINSINCKKLLKTEDGQDSGNLSLFHYTLGTEITYEQNGVVYIRNNNKFDTLYNFKASIGDKWKMIWQCDSTSNITVLDTGTIIINSTPLKFLKVNLHFNTNNLPKDSQDTIIEKIGFIGSYYIASDFCYAALDGAEGGNLQCYNDANFSTYKSHWATSCTFTVGIEEFKKETSIHIFPNPASNFITIITNKPFEQIKSIEFYNSFGQIVLLPKQLNKIDITELQNGLYFIKVTNNTGLTMITKFLKE